LAAPHFSPPPIIGEPPFQWLFPPNGDTHGIRGVTPKGVKTRRAAEELSVLEGRKMVALGHAPKVLESMTIPIAALP